MVAVGAEISVSLFMFVGIYRQVFFFTIGKLWSPISIIMTLNIFRCIDERQIFAGLEIRR